MKQFVNFSLNALFCALLPNTALPNQPEQPHTVAEYTSSTPGKLYQLKLGAGVSQAGKSSNSMPILSLAKRYELGNAAIEISGSWGKQKSDSGYKSVYLSLPKVSYLAFLEPGRNNSFYYGGGLSWGYVQHSSTLTDVNNYFKGLFAEGTIGYELHRTTAIRTMLELNLSQPLIANSKKGAHPGPTAFVSMSFGF